MSERVPDPVGLLRRVASWEPDTETIEYAIESHNPDDPYTPLALHIARYIKDRADEDVLFEAASMADRIEAEQPLRVEPSEKPENVIEFEEGADSGDPWWRDGYHVEDVTGIALWYRRELETARSQLQEAREAMRMAWGMLDTYADCDEAYGTGCSRDLVRETAERLWNLTEAVASTGKGEVPTMEEG